MIDKIVFTGKYIVNNIKKTKINNNRSIEEYIDIPFLENFVPQGLCIIENYILITLYDGDKISNSKILILKNNELYKTVYIDNKYHLGGITYDNIHDLIWITTTNGAISAYDKDVVFNAQNEEIIYPKFNNIKLGSDFINIFKQNRIAYIAYYNNQIYVGNYHDSKNSILRIYNLNKDGYIDIDSCITKKFIGYTQGITFYDNKILVSSSCGRKLKSRLTLIDSNFNITNTFLLPSMMEQIFVKENKLYTLFEINAIKFNSRNKKRKDILIYNISDFIN